MSHHTMTGSALDTTWTWKNRPGYKPILLVIAAVVLTAVVLLPAPQSMIDMVSRANPPGYNLETDCNTITDTVNRKLRPAAFKVEKLGKPAPANQRDERLFTPQEVARMAKIMVAILFLAAFLWGTEALPLGATDVLVGVMLYLFAILPINEISEAYMSDAVFFIFGILAVAVGISQTGLDKRIGFILLGRIKSTKTFAFLFLPMLAVFSGFLSAHALVALLIPVLMGVYKVTCKIHGVEKDRALAIFLLLGVCFASNHGGPGSPAAGGRNAIMVGYLMEYGFPITFLEWMKTGLPYVPLMAVVTGAYMFICCKPKFLSLIHI